MGADIYWNKAPLNGEVGDAELEAVLKWADVGPTVRTVEGMNAQASMVFRLSESLGNYFRANVHNWPGIVAEMEHRGMIGDGFSRTDGLMPIARIRGNGNGEPVTPREIVKALDADPYPILPMLTIGDDGDKAHLPGLWVRWLCFMERAAEIGDGFTVS